MNKYTIYSETLWKRVLEKYPTIKEICVKLGIENDPKKAKEISKKYKHNFGYPDLNDDERELAVRLAVVEMQEYSLTKNAKTVPKEKTIK